MVFYGRNHTIQVFNLIILNLMVLDCYFFSIKFKVVYKSNNT